MKLFEDISKLLATSLLFVSLSACSKEEVKIETVPPQQEAAKESAKNKAKPSSKYSPVVVQQGVCNASLALNAKPIVKQQTIKLNDKVSIDMKQYLSTHSHKGVAIADNTICQKLNGAKYTGSNEEWIGFINNAVNGLKNSGGKEMMLKLMAEEKDKVYKGDNPHREYYFEGDFGGNSQVIYNLAVLDKRKNIIYTLSVSGAFRARTIVKEEYKRLVKSFKL